MEDRRSRDLGVREIKKGRKWLRWAMLVLVIGLLLAGYKQGYEPRAEAKNYASYASIILTGVEVKLAYFKTTDEVARVKILQSLPGLWDEFCEIECPDQPRTFEIMWKMAKVLEYTRIYMSHPLQADFMNMGSREAGEWDITEGDVQARIEDLQWLINDTIAYGNFKRWE